MIAIEILATIFAKIFGLTIFKLETNAGVIKENLIGSPIPRAGLWPYAPNPVWRITILCQVADVGFAPDSASKADVPGLPVRARNDDIAIIKIFGYGIEH